MKILLSRNSLDLSAEATRALKDEIHFACTQVSVFPIMEKLLEFMGD